MKVIEQFVKGKFNNEELCEDGICVTENFIALIDGVSSQSQFRYNGKKLGKVMCEILLEAIPKIEATYNCDEAIDFLNKYILDFYKKINIYEDIKDDATKQPSASIIMYSKYYNQIWLIGDCMALYGDKTIENKLEIDELYTKIRVMAIEYLLETEYTEEQLLEKDISAEFVNELIKRQPYIRNVVNNSKYDYVNIDGFNKPCPELVKCIDIDENVHEIVFTSDGYIRPFRTLAEAEENLKSVKEEDPLRYKKYKFFKAFYKGQESYDDRAYIRFEI